jgi:hypothetical protein
MHLGRLCLPGAGHGAVPRSAFSCTAPLLGSYARLAFIPLIVIGLLKLPRQMTNRSIGIAVSGSGELSVDELTHYADLTMYDAQAPPERPIVPAR